MSYNICCPQCGNPDLQVINESNTQTSGGSYSAGKGCLGYLIFGPLGLLCGGCGSGAKSTTTNTTYWVCPKCGKKFKSPQDLHKEVEAQRKGIPAMIICGILMTIFAFFIIFGVVLKGEHIDGGLSFFSIIIGLLPLIISIIASNATTKSLDAKEIEIFEIEEKMKKFASNAQCTTNSINTQFSNSNASITQWTCSCGSSNNLSNNYCKTCGEKRKYKSQYNTTARGNVNASEWLCPKCGRINQNYVGTCGCGEIKPSQKTTSNNNEIKYITCPECKTKQTSDHTNCYRCGYKLNL